jgi:hypothetical protein
MDLQPFKQMIDKAIQAVHRSAPVDLISLPAESGERFIGNDGQIQINFKDVACIGC